jgi:phenylpropionate dioxygenase-like ring-hydroxylating dioxygenase large terminal subunit
MGVPREETFKNLDKASRNLVALPAQESGGLIWVQLDRHAAPDFSSLSEQVALDLTSMGIPNCHIYGRKSFEVKANWKLVLEPFLEGYHVQRLHARSIGRLFADTPNIADRFGLHYRQISGKAHYTPQALDDTDANIHATVTHAYQLFPSTVIVTSPYYISVMIIMPQSVGRSTVEYFMTTRSAPDNPKAEELYARSYETILNVFGGEDFRAAEWSQEGLAAGALENVVYCGLEEAIPQYYDVLDKLVAGGSL